MFGSCLSCHVFERDAEVVSLFIHLGFALSHAENASAASATAPAAHEEYPQEHHQYDGSELEEYVGDEATFLVIVADVGYLALLLHGVEVATELVKRAVFYHNVWLRAHLARVLAEHIAYVLCLDVHLQGVLFLAYDHVLGVTLSYILLELGVCCRLTGRCVAAKSIASASKEEYCQTYDDHGVNPVHIEPGHLRLVVVLLWIVVVYHLLSLSLVY